MAKPPKIIIADDLPQNRLALRTILRNGAVDLIEAESGNAVLILALKHDDIALILLDVQMPGMDGYETARLLRDESRTQNIPIIFLTALNHDEEYVLRGYDAGGIDYLHKPLVPKIIQAKVKLFVELWQVNQKLVAEVESRREAEKEINHMAMHDQLTELPNRAQLLKNLELGIARVDRYGGKLAAIFLDLDGFKPVNDLYGHDAGDQVLKILAQRLKTMMRPTDTVSRFGGDEFVIVMTDLSSIDEIKFKLQAIVEAAKEDIDWRGTKLSLGASLGVALYPGHGQDSSELIKSADKAMYRAKKSGKTCYRVYQDSDQQSINEAYNRRILEGLNNAIEGDEFELRYQPIVNAKTFDLVAVEALLRWHSPEFGEVGPLSFLPLVEDHQMMTELETWILEHSLADAVSWWQRTDEKIKVMVNISANHLGSAQVGNNIDELLKSKTCLAGLSAGVDSVSDFIGLEIQEEGLNKAFNLASTTLCDIHSQGFGISIDNFGSQGIGLKFLNADVVSTIKIGRDIIQQVVDCEDKQKLVSAICSMAHIFGFKVIALGVETERQLRVVQKLNCDYVQGFYFSEALSSDNLFAYMKKTKDTKKVVS